LIYIVVQGDTLIGIAGRYGITPEMLIAANPGVQAAVLPVGTQLIIPAGDATPPESLPTPVPLSIQRARCWIESDGGLWCFALLPNPTADTLENLSAEFTLLDAGGHEFASGTAFGLLDILPPGESVPLAIHFPPQEKTEFSVTAHMLTALRLLSGDTRYLPVILENILVTVDSSGRTAQASGRVIMSGAGTASTLWVLATAYDTEGNVVGVRRWESTSVLSTGGLVSFDFLVSSVGPVIDRVKFLAEARP
jgi:LysM repeat protein